MHLVAPQYSDGLDLYIYSYKIVGGGLNGQHLVEINNLNHYIGMAPILQADFLEMRWMPFIFGLIIADDPPLGRFRPDGQRGRSVRGLLLLRHLLDRIVLVPALPVWAQSRSARADAHQAVHAAAASARNKSRISASPVIPKLGAYLLCLSVLLIVLAGWFSRKEKAACSMSEARLRIVLASRDSCALAHDHTQFGALRAATLQERSMRLRLTRPFASKPACTPARS